MFRRNRPKPRSSVISIASVRVINCKDRHGGRNAHVRYVRMRIFARVRIAPRRGILGDGGCLQCRRTDLKNRRDGMRLATLHSRRERIIYSCAKTKWRDCSNRSGVCLPSFIRAARLGTARRALTLARAKVASAPAGLWIISTVYKIVR